MKLILIRHGETNENRKLILQGQTEGTLSKTGLLQIDKVARALRDEKIDVAYSSDLIRARMTCEKILEYHPHVKMNFSKELRERSFGIYEGCIRTEFYNMVDKSGIPYLQYRPEGGESFEDLLMRGKEFVEGLYKENMEKTVLLASHGGLIGTMLIHFNNDTLSKIRQYIPENTGISIVERNGEDQWNIIKRDDISHLKGFSYVLRRWIRRMERK